MPSRLFESWASQTRPAVFGYSNCSSLIHTCILTYDILLTLIHYLRVCIRASLPRRRSGVFVDADADIDVDDFCFSQYFKLVYGS
ncbi:hypothetical protein BDW66DRAFT_132245 [Aspergillus desertorum]